MFYGIIPSNPLACWGEVRQKRNHGENCAESFSSWEAKLLWPTEQVLAVKAKVREQRDLEYRDESPVETVMVAVTLLRATGVLIGVKAPQCTLVTNLAQSAGP